MLLCKCGINPAQLFYLYKGGAPLPTTEEHANLRIDMCVKCNTVALFALVNNQWIRNIPSE